MSQNDSCALVDNGDALAATLKAHESVVALFYASWCPFCVRFLPVFQKLAQGRKESFLVVQDDREEMAGTYGVEVYPTVLLIRKGIVAKRLDGIAGIGLDELMLSGFLASLQAAPDSAAK